MSNLSTASGGPSISSSGGGGGDSKTAPQSSGNTTGSAPKRKRSLPGTPDPDAEVIALSPRTLLTTNRFVCEICNKGFQRDQNLQLHRRGHNLPWKLKQRSGKEVKKRVYICPETSCVHHDPARALGDLTGVKKHFCRKHGEKKWKCDKCSKRYAVQSDWKAHSKTCGTREYRCDCGTLFSRRDSFITHRAFCDALAEESARVSITANNGIMGIGMGMGMGTGTGMTSLTHNNNNSHQSSSLSLFRGANSTPTATSSMMLRPLNAHQQQFPFGLRALPTNNSGLIGGVNTRQTTTTTPAHLSLWSEAASNAETAGQMEGFLLSHQQQTHEMNDGNPGPTALYPAKAMLGLTEYDDSEQDASAKAMLTHHHHLYPNPGAATNSVLNTSSSRMVLPSPSDADFGVANWSDRSRSGGGGGGVAAASSSRLSLSNSSTSANTDNNSNVDSLYNTNASNNNNIASEHHHHHNNNNQMYSSNQQMQIMNPQMSATALLQKAAQMGVSSSASMFGSFGMAGPDAATSHVGLGLSWQDSHSHFHQQPHPSQYQPNPSQYLSALDQHNHRHGGIKLESSAPSSTTKAPSSPSSANANANAAAIQDLINMNMNSLTQGCLFGMTDNAYNNTNTNRIMMINSLSSQDRLTRDFLGVNGGGMAIPGMDRLVATYHNNNNNINTDPNHNHHHNNMSTLSPSRSWDGT